jgi:hypothetical protein
VGSLDVGGDILVLLPRGRLVLQESSVRPSLFYRDTKNGYKNHSEKGARGVDVETASAAASLDALIEKRSRQRDEANSIEEMWAASERKHKARVRQEHRELWIDYYRRMAESHALLSAEHQRRARALMASEAEAS